MGRSSNVVGMVGQVFTRATVLGETSQRDGGGCIVYDCLCSCGTHFRASGRDLRAKSTKSCGCYSREMAGLRAKQLMTTHGHTVGKTISGAYRSWLTMRRRCLDEAYRDYPRYGGAGIRVAEHWLKFENFYTDMGDRPPGKTLDRIDNDGAYAPGNCRWATPEQQMNNTRRNRWFTWGGETLTISQWSRRQGLPRPRVSARINLLKWSVERALELAP